MHILIATDADWIVDEITAAVGGPDTSFTVCRDGKLVSQLVAEREPDLVVTDLQVGSMGGMAIAMALRLDESAGVVPHVPIVMLLDRVADVYLAQRSQADAWLVKPLDALRLRRATTAAITGEPYTEGLPVDVTEDEAVEGDADQPGDGGSDGEAPGGETPDGGDTEHQATAEEEPANAG